MFLYVTFMRLWIKNASWLVIDFKLSGCKIVSCHMRLSFLKFHIASSLFCSSLGVSTLAFRRVDVDISFFPFSVTAQLTLLIFFHPSYPQYMKPLPFSRSFPSHFLRLQSQSFSPHEWSATSTKLPSLRFYFKLLCIFLSITIPKFKVNLYVRIFITIHIMCNSYYYYYPCKKRNINFRLNFFIFLHFTNFPFIVLVLYIY